MFAGLTQTTGEFMYRVIFTKEEAVFYHVVQKLHFCNNVRSPVSFICAEWTGYSANKTSPNIYQIVNGVITKKSLVYT